MMTCLDNPGQCDFVSPLDNSNPVENQIRPLVLNRKNALFVGRDTEGKPKGLLHH